MMRDIAAPELIHRVESRYGPMLCLVQDGYIGKALIEYGEYSESEVAIWRCLIAPDAVVVDAGANIGTHTVALAQMVPRGLVVAVEPLRFLFHLLCGNVALNGLTNVMTYHAALGEARGVTYVPPIDYTVASNYGGLGLEGRTAGNPVPVLPLDQVVGKVDFIKADVEGMERAVLAGAAGLIQRCHPILYVENNWEDYDHRVLGERAQSLIDHIRGLGYDLWWHFAPHFNPRNFAQNPRSPEEEIVSTNMLALPRGVPAPSGLDPV